MNDTTNQDEYYFEEPESSPSAYGATSSDAGVSRFMERVKRRNILIAIGVIVLAFVIYKMLGLFFSDHTPTKHSATPLPVVKPVQPAKHAMPLGLQQKLENIEQNDKVSHAKLASLGGAVNTMQQSFDQLNATMSSINNSLQTIAAQLQAQMTLLKNLQPKKTAHTQHQKTKALPVYFIKAMIPGRAWVYRAAASGADMRTVSVGDEIPGYGKIQHILPKKGMILTASGRQIYYSPGDS